MPPLKKRILLVLPHRGFRDEEYDQLKEFFVKRKFLTEVASSTDETPARGMFESDVNVDLTLAAAQPYNFDAVVFLGGEGVKQMWENKHALKLATEAAKEGKILAAIDFAPVILANAGVLEGRRATCFPSEQARLLMKRGRYTGRIVEQDGDIITAAFPTAIATCSQKILERLELRGGAVSAADADVPEDGVYEL